MATTNLNIRTDKEIKREAEEIYNKLGLNMTTAINLFLRASIRENGIPFNLILDEPNSETLKAIDEGRKIAENKNILGYDNIDDLKAALER